MMLVGEVTLSIALRVTVLESTRRKHFDFL